MTMRFWFVFILIELTVRYCLINPERMQERRFYDKPHSRVNGNREASVLRARFSEKSMQDAQPARRVRASSRPFQAGDLGTDRGYGNKLLACSHGRE